MGLLLRVLDAASEISQAEKGFRTYLRMMRMVNPWVGPKGLDQGGFSLRRGSVGRLTPDVSLVGSILNFKKKLCGRWQFACFYMLMISNHQNIGISVPIHP